MANYGIKIDLMKLKGGVHEKPQGADQHEALLDYPR